MILIDYFLHFAVCSRHRNLISQNLFFGYSLDGRKNSRIPRVPSSRDEEAYLNIRLSSLLAQSLRNIS